MHTPTRQGTHTHARTHTDKYVVLIAFPRQRWFRERASLLCYTYIASLVTHTRARARARTRTRTPVSVLFIRAVLYLYTCSL